jgi:hypothetical protein
MNETEKFIKIDEGIDIFMHNEGYGKRIKVDKKPKSDWFVFKCRQLTWNVNDLEYLIEIFPRLDKAGESISWSLYSAVYYDSEGSRYYYKHFFSKEESLDSIADNIVELLVTSFNHISSVQKEDIPCSIRLN